MTDTELLESIREIIRDELTDLGLRKPPSETMSAFKKTEQLLWHYEEFVELINNKREQIADIQRYGVPGKSKDITEYHGDGGFVQGGTVQGTVQGAIDTLKTDIAFVQSCVDRINCALEAVKDMPDKDMVRDYYNLGYTGEELAQKYGTSVPTAFKRKNAVVRQIALYLFPEDAIKELIS